MTTADERDLVMVNVGALDAIIDQADNAASAMLPEVPALPWVPVLRGSWDRTGDEPRAVFIEPTLWQNESGFFAPVAAADEASAMISGFCKTWIFGDYSRSLGDVHNVWQDELNAYIDARGAWLSALNGFDFPAMAGELNGAIKRLQGGYGLDRATWRPGRRKKDYTPALAAASDILNDTAALLAQGFTFEQPSVHSEQYFFGSMTLELFGCDEHSDSDSIAKHRPETTLGAVDADERWEEFRARVAASGMAMAGSAAGIAAMPAALRRLRDSIYLFRRGSQYRFRGE
ncbi:MAG TPA: hypothetical protein VK514_13185 [Candidatus Acidoferrum sp.]|nr:hypothetical protein [Candidatus Acidoferrum sp.]